ncbi:MAG: tetratricopeptide repeat protein [Planctomycetota bacterium]
MIRIALTLLLVCLVAPLASAQNERLPETYRIAIGLQKRGLHDEAVDYLRRFVKQSTAGSFAAEAHYRLAQSLTELGKIDEAIPALRQAVAKGGPTFSLRAESLYRLGGLLQGEGKHADALESYQALGQAIDKTHYLSAAQSYAEGEMLRELGRDEEAGVAFSRAAERAVGKQQNFLFPARYQQGFAALRRQQYEAAVDAFGEALAVAPDAEARGECSYLIGDAWLRLEQYDSAEKAFVAVAQYGGSYADDAAFGLGWVGLGRDDRGAAIQAFNRVIQRHADSPFVGTARLECGRCYYQDKEYERALATLQPLLDPGNPLQQQARELEGLCALASGAGKAAVDSLQQAIQEAAAADKPRLWFALGEAFATQQQWQQALTAYGNVPKEAGDELFGDARYGACHALHELGQHQESLQAATAVLAIEPAHRTRVLAQLALAENHFALAQYEACEPVYEQLQQLAPHRELASWKLAWCRYLRGDKAAAARRFGAIAADKAAAEENVEEALAMQTLALFEEQRGEDALQAADRYRARYRDGRFLDRTERIAARVLQKRGDLGAAQRRLARAAAIARQKDDGGSAGEDVAEQADLAYQQGDFDQADKLFAEIVARRDAVGARAMAGRAWCAFELGDDDACLERLAAAGKHPEAEGELAGLLELESAVQHRREAWPDAIRVARSFLQRFPQNDKVPTLRYALGVALARDGQNEQARKELAALAAASGEGAAGGYEPLDRVLYELAWACRRDGDEAAALANFRRVAATSESVELQSEAKLFVGTAMLAGDKLAEARGMLEAVQGSYRNQALYRLGFAELEAGGGGEGGAAVGAEGRANIDRKLLAAARDHFGLIASEPGHELVGEALFLGAESCRRLGDAKGAVQRGQRLLRELPEHERAQRARLVVGECALQLEQPGDAIPPLEEFVRGDFGANGGEGESQEGGDGAAAARRADGARAYLWLGRARVLRRQFDQAEQSFAKVTELSNGPLAAEAQFRIGESRGLRQDWNGAADAFVKLPILYGDAEWVRRGLLGAGQAYDRLRQPAKAERFYRELLDKHQDTDEAKAAAAALKERENR